jgi:hypothetical protein
MFTGLKYASGLSSERRRPAHCHSVAVAVARGACGNRPEGPKRSRCAHWECHSGLAIARRPPAGANAGPLEVSKVYTSVYLENSTNPTPGTMPVVPQGDVTISVSYACTPIRYTDSAAERIRGERVTWAGRVAIVAAVGVVAVSSVVDNVPQDDSPPDDE